MSSPFVGIDNVNEFYGEHYLSAILAGDLQATLNRWKERGGEERTPPRALSALNARYFRFRQDLDRASDVEERVSLAREWWAHLLDALGFTLAPVLRDLSGGRVPTLVEARRPDGTPLLWILPSLARRHDDTEPLARPMLRELLTVAGDDDVPLGEKPSLDSLQDLVTAAFDLEEWPRFVLVLSESDITLAERARWSEQRLLRFELDEILGRRERDTLDVTACLLHRDCLAPADGSTLMDSLDDSSHKHAYGVSEDLKYALRECIELLGNEAARQIATRAREQKTAIPWDNLADPLSRECLRYMYRLLFLFYIEARPELGYAPMGADAYVWGYSLERLRAVEEAELLEPDAHDGAYLHESIQLLFRMVYEGAEPRTQHALGFGAREEESLFKTFRLRPLRSHLFDPERTLLLNQVRFPNHVLRTVIEKMSLSRGKVGGGKGRRGRVSYATLGINQLGAVYEALLSFRGFFAREELFEVKPAGGDHGPLDPAYFVNQAALKDYTEEERVFETIDGVKQLVRHARGTFIYRMAGRDRQKSASYYTPAVLTRAVVKYALKEILEDEAGNTRLTSAEILDLKVLEPAVGSAAFLNEAVDQLAEAYLHRAQKERGERLGHERYAWEKQRVKMVLADRNVFGIDFNPIAIELAEVSLWLNAIFGEKPLEKGEEASEEDRRVFVPWFGMQLCNGNSLVGARRQAFSAAETDPGKQGKAAPWLAAVPARVPIGSSRPKEATWHFLLPDRGMATYGKGGEGKPIQEMCASELAHIEEWKTEVCAPLESEEREWLVELSGAIDRLWDNHVRLLKDVRDRTTDPLPVYGREADGGTKPTSTREKDRIWDEEMASDGVKASSPYRRLKLAMDYWCALWFWPIEKADLLPSRQEWLLELSLLLDQTVLEAVGGDDDPQRKLFASTRPLDEVRKLVRDLGFVDVPGLVKRYPRLALVQELAERYRFFHWELEFADVFAERGGFDVVLGNPPWIRVEWNDTDELSEHDPRLVIRRWKKDECIEPRKAAIATEAAWKGWTSSHEAASGLQNFLSSRTLFPSLSGCKVNLYKVFLQQAWSAMHGGRVAVGFLHPEGVFDEADAGLLRAAMYPRLRKYFQFENELGLFQGTNDHGRMRFAICCYGQFTTSVHFEHMANVFHPATIDDSYSHAGFGSIPQVKTSNGHWCISGHRDRVVVVRSAELEVFSKLFNSGGSDPIGARMPSIHSKQILEVLRRLANTGCSLAESGTPYHPTYHFNETYAVQDRVIKRETGFPGSSSDLVISGPHFYVSNPLYQTPRSRYSNNSQYDPIDLTYIPSSYLPRGNFRILDATRSAGPKTRWAAERTTDDYYRVVVSKRLNLSGERTLQPAIIPPGIKHIGAVYSYAMPEPWSVLVLAGFWSSLVADFMLKVMSPDDLVPAIGARLPYVAEGPYIDAIAARTLALNCVHEGYDSMWRTCIGRLRQSSAWSSQDPRLGEGVIQAVGTSWARSSPLRTDFGRRQALVEIDVLVAMSLGMDIDHLIQIYSTQFPVLMQNERSTWYDRMGRIVYTENSGLKNVGLPPRTPNSTAHEDSWADTSDPTTFVGTLSKTFEDDTLPGGPHVRTITYQGPFDRCDREQDYRQAWAVFASRFGATKPRNEP